MSRIVFLLFAFATLSPHVFARQPTLIADCWLFTQSRGGDPGFEVRESRENASSAQFEMQRYGVRAWAAAEPGFLRSIGHGSLLWQNAQSQTPWWLGYASGTATYAKNIVINTGTIPPSTRFPLRLRLEKPRVAARGIVHPDPIQFYNYPSASVSASVKAQGVASGFWQQTWRWNGDPHIAPFELVPADPGPVLMTLNYPWSGSVNIAVKLVSSGYATDPNASKLNPDYPAEATGTLGWGGCISVEDADGNPLPSYTLDDPDGFFYARRNCVAPSVATAAFASGTSCHAQTISLSVVADGTRTPTYQWRKNSISIDASINPSAASPTLTLDQSPDRAGSYDCVVTNGCGSATSNPVMLTACPADFNCDAFLDFSDFDDWIVAFESGQPVADANGDGFLDFTDFDTFIGQFIAGC